MATVKSRPSLNENFILRGQSYKAGMGLLVRHLTAQEWKLGNKFSARTDLISEQIDRLYKDYENDLQKDKGISFETADARFKSLLASYISILVFHTTLKVPLESLCVAERCAVWHKGHEKFDTLVSFVSEDSQLASLEIAHSETPCTDNVILLPEYRAESKTFWFETLPKWMQDFIKENAEELSEQPIPSSLRNVPGLANLWIHSFKINDVEVLRNFRHATPAPIDLMADKQASDERLRLSCLNLASQIRLSLDEQLKATGSLNQQELVILTQSLLSPGFAATLKADYFTDASDNDTLLYEMKERVVELFQWALSNPNKQIAAIDAKIKTIFFTEEEQLKTLYYKDFLAKFDLMVHSDGYIKYKQHKPVKITLLSTNHPFNILRHFGVHPDQTKRNDFNTALLLNAVGRYLSPLLFKKNSTHPPEQFPALLKYIEETKRSDEKNSTLRKLISELDLYGRNINSSAKKDKKELIKTIEDLLKKDSLDKNVELKQEDKFDKNTVRLLDALQALLAIPTTQGVLTADTRHYQMLISSAEMVILNCIGGIAWVACKSGKDRTGGALSANGATAAFYALKARHPRHDDEKLDRALYLELLKEFFESGHHQHVASENAPGAEGLIKLSNFTPSDLALDVKNIRLETRLARLNKPAHLERENTNFFNVRNYKEELQQIINRVPGNNKHDAFQDWNRHMDAYFIGGISIKKLREVEVDGKLISKPFSDQNDLSKFIEDHLLQHVEDSNLKKYYLALVLQSFRSAQFPHAFAIGAMQLINKKLSKKGAIIGQPQMCINFSYKEDSASIQIEEINTFKNKRYYKIGNQEQVSRENEEGDYCQTHSSFVLKLIKRGKGYKLATMDEAVRVTCVDELKDIFLKKFSYLEAIWDFLLATIAAIKQYFDELVRSVNVLDEKWLIKVKTPTKRGGKEVRSQEPRDRDGCALTDEPENALPSKGELSRSISSFDSSSDFFKPIREREDSNKTTPQPSSSNTISYT